MKLMWYSRPNCFLTKVSLGQRMNGHRIHIEIGHYGNIFRIHKFSFFRHNVDTSSSNHPKFRIRLTKSACFATIPISLPISQNSGLVWDCNTANTLKPCPLLFQYNVRLKIQHGFQISISLYECPWFWLELHVLSSSSIQHFIMDTSIWKIYINRNDRKRSTSRSRGVVPQYSTQYCATSFFFNFLIFCTLWGLNPNSLNLRTHHQPLGHRGHDDHQQNITF